MKVTWIRGNTTVTITLKIELPGDLVDDRRLQYLANEIEGNTLTYIQGPFQKLEFEDGK